MSVLDSFLGMSVPLSLPLLASGPAGMWAYVGLGPGQEFIPQFLALLGLAATALLAVIQWPILTLWSRLSRSYAARKNERINQAGAPSAAEQPGADHTDKP